MEGKLDRTKVDKRSAREYCFGSGSQPHTGHSSAVFGASVTQKPAAKPLPEEGVKARDTVVVETEVVTRGSAECDEVDKWSAGHLCQWQNMQAWCGALPRALAWKAGGRVEGHRRWGQRIPPVASAFGELSIANACASGAWWSIILGCLRAQHQGGWCNSLNKTEPAKKAQLVVPFPQIHYRYIPVDNNACRCWSATVRRMDRTALTPGKYES